jgi:hypothetical protein
VSGCHSRSRSNGKEKNLPLAGMSPGLDRTFIWKIIGSNVGRRFGNPQWVWGKWCERPGRQGAGVGKVNILNNKKKRFSAFNRF